MKSDPFEAAAKAFEDRVEALEADIDRLRVIVIVGILAMVALIVLLN